MTTVALVGCEGVFRLNPSLPPPPHLKIQPPRHALLQNVCFSRSPLTPLRMNARVLRVAPRVVRARFASASAEWNGTLKQGKGTISVPSKVCCVLFSVPAQCSGSAFRVRFFFALKLCARLPPSHCFRVGVGLELAASGLFLGLLGLAGFRVFLFGLCRSPYGAQASSRSGLAWPIHCLFYDCKKPKKQKMVKKTL